MLKLFLTYSLIIISLASFSQSAMSLNVRTFGIHPFGIDQDPAMFENKLTEDGSWIFEPGYELNYQKFLYLTTISFELKQGLFSDAAAKLGGYFGLGFRMKFFHLNRHSFSISLSPVYSFRENWKNIIQYEEKGDYKDNGMYQYRFLLSSSLTYNVYIGKRHDLAFTLHYNDYLSTLSLSLGYRFWFNTTVKFRDKKCDTCGKQFDQGKFRRFWRKVWR
ncbi:MAG: hypothetical protein JXR60_03305 [Bacteroidales bacterium]|nr:hypothetical protein [Bacteroidales bacterium]